MEKWINWHIEMISQNSSNCLYHHGNRDIYKRGLYIYMFKAGVAVQHLHNWREEYILQDAQKIFIETYAHES